MWEQIASNQRRTTVLVVAMAVVLVTLGYVVGESVAPGGGAGGLLVAFGVWFVLTLVAYFQGDNILLAVSGARKIEKQDHPQLFNVVEEMTIASGRGKPPDVYVTDDMAMNAFAAGRNPDKAVVAVTAGLLGALNRDELQGVVAHEMAHIKNRDVLLMTMVGVTLGAIVMISEMFLRSLRYSARQTRRYSSRGKGGGHGQAAIAVIAIVFAILAPVLAQLIYFAVSRRREYLADASAAVFTRYPEGLASALEKISSSDKPLARATRATAPMFIVNPFKKASLTGLFSTHPPTEERVRILRSMGGMANFGAYQVAWRAVGGRKAGNLPESALTEDAPVRAREALTEAKSPRQRLREAGDLLRKTNAFLFLPCVCGLRLKIPPNFAHDSVECPRCHRSLAVPVAEMAAMAQVAEGVAGQMPAGGEELTVHRTGGGWISFKCTCGATNSISPSFAGDRTTCKRCGRAIRITR